MKTINIIDTVLRDSFYLSEYKEVESFEDAKIYGGATLVNSKLISNIEGTNNITIKDRNILSIIIPSTKDADVVADDFKEYVEYIKDILVSKYHTEPIKDYSKGSWYSEDLNKVIIEDNCILTIEKDDITTDDINFIYNLGIQVRNERSQEAVSILFNNSLAII